MSKTYNPNEVSISFSAVDLMGGLADGEFLDWDWLSDAVESVAGTDGEVALSPNLDRRVRANLHLLETSSLHKTLSAFYKLHQAGGGQLGIGPFLYKDANTGELLTSPNAAIMRPPAGSKNRSATERVWSFILTNAEYAYI
jgi:hypothetical protein